MTIESSGLDKPALTGLSQSPGPADNRDRWLAALEEASFKVSDDLLLPPRPGVSTERGGSSDEMPRAPHPGDGEQPLSAAVIPTPGTVERVRAAMLQAQQLSPGPVPARTVNTQAPVPAPAHPNPTSMYPSPPASASTPQGRAAGPSLEALFNQVRFIDVNLQLTRSNEGMTLWIRDFQNRYAEELVHWVQDLQAMLKHQGRPLARIMLNGKPLQQITDILRR